MNTIAHNVASKLFVAFVAVAMLFTLVSPAKAATAEEMQQMINQLLAQVAQLQGSMGQGSAAGMCPYTWTRSLKTGDTGMDVMKLQQFLNSDADTRVSASGVGSAGMETEFFGPATAAAVSKFQVKYRSDVLSPAGLVNPTGVFGPASMAKANMLCTTPVVVPPTTGGDTTGGDDDMDDDMSSSDLSGEAALDTYEVADGDDADDVEEGMEDAVVAEITLEFSDGDAIVNRMDIALDKDSGDDADSDDDDPFDNFDEVSLWVDGEEVARMDASDEDEYLDEDDGSLRFSGLDILAMEDEEVVVSVAVSVQGSIDGVGSSDDEDWIVAGGPVRYTDADDVTTTEDGVEDQQSMDGTYDQSKAAAFSVEEAGAGDDLDLETSDEDPDATTISLDEDDNTEALIFAFDLSADDSDGDIDLNDITVGVQVGGSGTSVDTLVNDFRLEIDGNSYEPESYTGTGSTTEVTFEVDGDTTVAEDETVTALLYADFENMDNSALEGSTITATVTPANIDAEGVEDFNPDGSAKSGETHTLRTEGLDLGSVTDGTGSSDSTVVDSDTANDTYGTMFLEFEVTAFGDDLFVKANNASRGASTTAGVAFTIEDSAGSASTSGAVSVTYDIEGADEENGFFQLEDGETYTMTVTVNSFNPLPAGGTYHLQILSVGFAATEVNATSSQAPDDLNDYESDDVFIES